MKHKIRAFTIIELVVVMLLTSVIIGIVYTTYRIVDTQYSNYRKISSMNTDIALLTMLLNKDFANAFFIKKEEDKIIFSGNEGETAGYFFGEDFITRNSDNVKDTFLIPVISLEVLYLNQAPMIQNNLIDELYFESTIFEEEYFFRFKKEYAADVLMESEPE